MNSPAFTIVCDTHGHEQYLREAIDSVVGQTDTDWELIVVDNGRSDEVARIVDTYADDQRIRLLRTEYEGMAAAVNTAITHATGEIYTVVHGNHKLLPDFCAHTYAALQAAPEADVIAVDAYRFDDHGAIVTPSYRREGGVEVEPGVDHRITLEEFVNGSVIYYSAAIRARAWHKGEGYPADLPVVEEFVLSARMMTAGCDIRVLPELLAACRLVDDPAKFAVYEDNMQRALTDLAAATGDPAVRAAVDHKLRETRFHQAMGRARKALSESDTHTARTQVRLALQQRRALRPAVVYAALTIAPGSLRLAQQLKRRLRG
ncbi:glycosyltransferase family A protein [Nocardia sp. CDC153]|uniref:glycosyltransferase family A protein n=1 Tax=Nocardia sp. CDC153 TaxID=3112167 RepID=UPI002DBDD377|nr:glycosyltransferase family A protein [Nocardia sp. CDC153]MEC3956287.1 glycosyltransferase family A protein [Nocardia sp. CDC153]